MSARRTAYIPVGTSDPVQTLSADDPADTIEIPASDAAAQAAGTAPGANVKLWIEILTVAGSTAQARLNGAGGGKTLAAGDLLGPFYATGDVPVDIFDGTGPNAVTCIVWLGD